MFPWGVCTTGVQAHKAALMQRFHRVRSTLVRCEEEEVLLRVEAERGVIYFDLCVTAIKDAIEEFEAPVERIADPAADPAASAAWARTQGERAGRAFLLRGHLADYEALAKRARTLWSVWARNVKAPVAGATATGGGAAADAGIAGQDDGEAGGDEMA